jgi:uncharacterized protein DUF892
MELETLKDLYVRELKDLYSAENQLIKALPKMAKAAKNRQLASGFTQHLDQTKRHARRLEQILKGQGESTRGPKCEGMEGLIAEGDKMAKEDAQDEVRDAGLIAAAQLSGRSRRQISAATASRTLTRKNEMPFHCPPSGTKVRRFAVTISKRLISAHRSINWSPCLRVVEM